METGEYDEGHAITAVAEAVRGELVTDRLKYDQAAVEDVVKIIRAVGRATGNDDLGLRQMNPERV